MTTSVTREIETGSSAVLRRRGLSVSAKISLGFLIILVLHISIAVLGHYGLKKARRDLDRYHTTQHQVQRYNQIDRTVTGIQRNVMLFAFTGYEGPEARAVLLQDELEELLRQVDEHAEDETEREAIDEMQQHLRSHREIFQAVVVDRAKRRELVDQVLLNCGKEFEESLRCLRDSYPQSGVVATADAEFQAAQLESLLFVNRPDSVHLREAKAHLARALQALQSLDTTQSHETSQSHETTQSNDTIEKTQQAMEVVRRYETAFIQMVHATRGYLHLVNVVLAGESEEFRRLASDVRSEQTRRIDDLAHRMNLDRQRFQVASNVFSVVTIALGIAAAWRIGRDVAPPLNAITATFDGLVSGKDCDTIPGAGRGDELGRLAAAAQVFKDKAAETERLLLVAEGARAELKALNNQLGTQTEFAKRMAAEATAAARAKSEFLANMSHEIRTPMTAILGFTEILSSHCGEAERHATIETIRRNGEHLLMIINDILDLSKIEAGKMAIEPMSVAPREMMQGIAALTQIKADAAGLDIQIEVHDDVPPVIMTDPTRLRQILINLIGNAIKFTKTGSVQLLVHRALTENREWLYFDVVDTGIGMSPEDVRRLFYPFSQVDTTMKRQYGGTGLGLSISKRLAEMLGGKLDIVHTAPGQGSTFRLTLPIAEMGAVLHERAAPRILLPQTAPTDALPGKSLDGCRILLAEDGVDNQRLLQAILSKVGAQVVVVPTGRQALMTATEQQTQGTPFDCILMDMQMPDMDGYEATSALRALQYPYPIIALTAHAMEGDAKKCLDAGCDAYLTKPIVREHFVDSVKYWADRKGRLNFEGLAGSSF